MLAQYKASASTPCTLDSIDLEYKMDTSMLIPSVLYLSSNVDIVECSDGFLVFFGNKSFHTENASDVEIVKSMSAGVFSELIDSDTVSNLLSTGLVVKEKKEYTVREFYFPETYRADLSQLGWHTAVPLTVTVDATLFCNQKCIHCYRGSSPSQRDPAFAADKLKSICENAAINGTQTLNFLGGEPLAAKNIFQIAARARAMGVRSVTGSTNGTLISETNINQVVAAFTDLQVSIHGARPKTHDLIAGLSGAWTRAMNAVRLLRLHDMETIVSFTVMRQNIDEIVLFAKIITDMGAVPRFLSLFTGGRTNEDHLMSECEVRKAKENIRVVKSLFPTALFTGNEIESDSNVASDAIFYGCSGGRTQLNISATGNSCGICQKDFSLNTSFVSPLEMWYHKGMRIFREMPTCACDFATFCGGPCKLK